MKNFLTLFLIFSCVIASFAQTSPVKSQGKHGSKKAAPATSNDVIPMILVEGGGFSMGCDKWGDPTQTPVHHVVVGSYFIGKYEITVGQFRKFIQATGYKTNAELAGASYDLYQDKNVIMASINWLRHDGATWECDSYGVKRPVSQDNQPVVNVSWVDATKFCEWLSSKTGKTYRLPTDAEWEFAADGGVKSTGKEYGDINDDSLPLAAWYAQNSGAVTHPGGQKLANELGIYDMLGNVDEWCGDWFGSTYYANSPSDNPTGPPTGEERVIRGGNFTDNGSSCRPYSRASINPGLCMGYMGFRVVMVP